MAVRAVAVAPVIGYWREREGGPVLEQERTDAVIDLAQHPGWSIYGVVTKDHRAGQPHTHM